jgi:hypothetical protein
MLLLRSFFSEIVPWMKNITRQRKFLHMNGRQSHLLLPFNYKQASSNNTRPPIHNTIHSHRHLPADPRGYFIVAFFGIFLLLARSAHAICMAFYFIIFILYNFRLKYFWFSLFPHFFVEETKIY